MTKTKKESKKKFLILLLIVLLLALAVGYAAFSDTLEISGTANVNGSFDLQFVSGQCSVVEQKGCTANVSVGADSTSETNDKLTVTVENLAYPGAGAKIHAQIKNLGTIAAQVESVTITPNPATNGNAIVVTGLDTITTSHPTIQPNGTCDFDFKVMWDSAVTTLDNTKDGENSNNFTFTVSIQYKQATDLDVLNVTLDHTDANAVANP